jgi:outer membrane protein TolC
MMLEHDPNLAIGEAQLQSSRGALLAAQGSFDPVVSSSLRQEETDSPVLAGASEEVRVLGSTLGVTRKFRSGFSLEPELSLLRTEEIGGDPAGNLGTFSFTLRQPLLRGRGRTATLAPELSAERQVTASALDLRQTTSERALAVVSQYWLTRAAVLNLDILRESEERSRELLATTRKLIEADVTPAADLVQVEADVVAKETSRIGGERDLFESRQALGREIGLTRAEIAALPLPAEPFPTVAASAVPAPSAGDRLIAAALSRRSDLRAARERVDAAEILVRAADNSLKPRLDLVFTPSYSGLVAGTDAESFFSPLYRNVPGASSSLGFTLSWPPSNREARGALAQIEAARAQNESFRELVSRQIEADVPTALDAVARSAQQLERAAEAVRLFERSVANEEKKLRAGTSTLLDVISQRDRLTSARQAQVSAHLALALALVRLRFETGTLLPDGADLGQVGLADLTSIPAVPGGAP